MCRPNLQLSRVLLFLVLASVLPARSRFAASANLWPLDDAKLRLNGNVFTMSPLTASLALERELGITPQETGGQLTINLYDLTMQPEKGRGFDTILAGLRRDTDAQSQRMADQLLTLSRRAPSDRRYVIYDMLRTQPDSKRLADLYNQVAIYGRPVTLRVGDLEPRYNQAPWAFPDQRAGSFGSVWQIKFNDRDNPFGVPTTLEKLTTYLPKEEWFKNLLDPRHVLNTSCLQLGPAPSVVWNISAAIGPSSNGAEIVWDGPQPGTPMASGQNPPDQYYVSRIGPNGGGYVNQGVAASTWKWPSPSNKNFAAPIDTSLSYSTTYTYEVKPMRGGQCFGRLETVSVSTGQAPMAPALTNFKAVVQSDRKTRLTWDPPPGFTDNSVLLLGYTLSRREDVTGETTVLGNVSWWDPGTGIGPAKLWHQQAVGATTESGGAAMLGGGIIDAPNHRKPGVYTYTLNASWTPMLTPSPASTTATAQSTLPPPYGYADAHVHQMNHLGFGGYLGGFHGLLHGKPGGPIATALDDCASNLQDVAFRKTHGQMTPGSVNTNSCNDPQWCTRRPDGTCYPADILNRSGGPPYQCSVPNANPSTTDDFFGSMLRTQNPGNAHSIKGYPDFTDWDADMFTHQQVYKTWLKRAVDHGLRLMSMVASNSKTACIKVKAQQGVINTEAQCEDDVNVYQEIVGAYAFQDEIDAETGCANPNGHRRVDPALCGWYRIVTNSAQARQVVEEGKLAVVLGVETSELFGCSARDTTDVNISGLAKCRQQNYLGSGLSYVDYKVKELADMGVRHVFPVHNIDNAFAGTAIYNEVFNGANREQNGYWYGYRVNNSVTTTANMNLWRCGLGLTTIDYGNNLPSDPAAVGKSRMLLNTLDYTRLNYLLGGIPAYLFGDQPLYAHWWMNPTTDYTDQGFCNNIGKSPLGTTLIRALMRNKMIIDIDHTGNLSGSQILDQTDFASYPVVASHTGLNDITSSAATVPVSNPFAQATMSANNEANKTGAEIARILKHKGFLSIGLAGGGGPESGISVTNDPSYTGKVIVNDCSGSTTSVAQALLYAGSVVKNHGYAWDGSFGISGDFNGWVGGVKERFGNSPCGQIGYLGPRTHTDFLEAGRNFTLRGPSGTQVPVLNLVDGNRTWDISVHGVAHIGMVPDMLAELKILVGQKSRTDTTPAKIDESDFDPLYRSANGFIEMWEQAEKMGPLVP